MKFFTLAILLVTSLYATNQKVSIQLQWKHQFQSAGYYIAKEKGFYNDVGLDVEIKELKKNMNVADEVLWGNSTFGIGRSSLIIQRNQGKKLVMIGATFQNSPLVLLTTNPKIKNITDLKNKRVMITQDAVSSASLLGMLFSNGLGKDEIVYQSHSFNYKDLINKKTDAMSSYISNEVYYLEKNNVEYNVFNPVEYGFDFYGDIVFTSQKEIEKNPKRVKAFRDATIKGWLWAFENIQETAQIIFEKYNSQNKTLESLVYEGHALKKLALVKNIPFFSINKEKVKSIARVFQLKGMLKEKFDVDKFVKEYKKEVKIGVLAKRGKDKALENWNPLVKYLNDELKYYDFKIIPLSFKNMQESVENKEIDFVVTNTMFYVLLESEYGVSRIATLVTSDKLNHHDLKKFGGVIFTKKSSKEINKIKDLKHKTIGAVDELSFGGWIMGYEKLVSNNIDDIDVRFLGTHDNVARAVLNSEVEVGIVRTDTLERMQDEGKIKLSDIKVIGLKKYDNFPYLVSTKLYPEWPIAKLVHTSNTLANKLLAKLVTYEAAKDDIAKNNIKGWTVPLDYSSVHTTLKKLRLKPYNNVNIHFDDIIKEYATHIYILSVLALLLIARLFYDYKYNKELDMAVREKTKKLILANKKLELIASTDDLTGISNRSHFMKFAKKYFEIAKRNKEELQMLSLDLDYFKNINDSYGHQAGDCVLKEFTKEVTSLLRKSDLFGRVGGEEFCIVLQNTSLDGAKDFSQRVCKSVEDKKMDCDGEILNITVSIGIASLGEEKSMDDLLKHSDVALYDAKDNGRNQVKFYL
jgi:diguanylate cyclase (GGDEF)-like protein